MNVHGYVAEHFLDDIDSFTPRERYRLLYDLPDGRHVAPEVERRMLYHGEKASEALKRVRRLFPMPFSPNSLSPALYDKPSLIDEERWDKARNKARADLRSQGV
jgi:hypothetical protein